MSKKIADGLHADAAFEQAHGEAMPQYIGGMTEERQSTAVNMALKRRGYCGARHRTDRCEPREEQLRPYRARPALAQVSGKDARCGR